MEFSTRIFSSPNLTRHFRTSAVFLKRHQPSLHSIPNKHPPLLIPSSTSTTSSSPIQFRGGIRASHSGSFSHRVSGRFGLFNSLFAPHITAGSNGASASPPDVDHSNKFSDYDSWSSKCTPGGDAEAGDKVPLVTAVLLGWLGAEPKHLRRYAELYNSRGMNSVHFVVSAREAVSIDMGKRLEGRIESLAREIESWLRDSGKDGRQRFLIFHTFSNTGWLVYGSLLEKFQGKKEILERIRGCVVDSGPDPGIHPKVWAAGFGTAILKRRSSTVYPLNNATSKTDTTTSISETQNKEITPIEEILLLALLEKMFNVLLYLPYINRRLKKTIGILTNNQPNCPQLYLYSSADKVIPYQYIESFIQDQRKKGREVLSFNFGTSPHVDHYRSFPEIYSSQLLKFLEISLAKTSS